MFTDEMKQKILALHGKQHAPYDDVDGFFDVSQEDEGYPDIDLSDAGLSDDDMPELKAFLENELVLNHESPYYSLDLSRNPITDDGAKVVATINTVSTVYIRGKHKLDGPEEITEACVADFAQNPNIRKLNLVWAKNIDNLGGYWDGNDDFGLMHMMGNRLKPFELAWSKPMPTEKWIDSKIQDNKALQRANAKKMQSTLFAMRTSTEESEPAASIAFPKIQEVT